MDDFISREATLQVVFDACTECMEACEEFDGIRPDCHQCLLEGVKLKLRDIPAADVRPVVTCAECKHNNACLTQAFVEEASRVPFDRNTFYCADGKRADDA